MIKTIKKFNPGQTLGNIFLVGTVILLSLYQTKFLFSLYWCIIMALMISNIYFLAKWSNRAKDIDSDKNKGKELIRTFNDITTVSLIFYALIFLGIQFMEYYIETITTNIYVAMGYYALTLIFQLFIFLAVDSARKETTKNLANNNLTKNR